MEFDIPQTSESSAIFIEEIWNTDSHFPDVSGIYYDLGIEDAWSRGYYGNKITVAIVDVGLEMSHEDLNKNVPFDSLTKIPLILKAEAI
ncbi:hypothetical protein CHS0354_038639 [Potamilus streckersoni]|uniref:Peptidase S8/S53 domain-containing protein n=1 Tax=Potamilus streckersoni TaxID=2493646 RepID=A0AAE0T7E9_9BIVA|nr:hypothetical protein CHS0354_038639 [Potamilus streckersoni]